MPGTICVATQSAAALMTRRPITCMSTLYAL
jgi:hypothetical protein